MLKVSIALCTYNGAQYIIEQLESFDRQTNPLTRRINYLR